MGYGRYSDDAYHSNVQSRVQTHGVRAFTHTHDIRQGRTQAAVHPRLDPRQLAGHVRESRDSENHPNSLAIGVFLDETGSMGHLPGIIQRKLPALMGLLVTRGYVQDPQVLFGAVGDANSDRAPLQVGQFESDVQMDEDLDKVYLEGDGGGGAPPCVANHESYGLAHYVFARHTATDCWEKRGRRGYLFTIGDEEPYDVVPREHVRRLIGGGVEGDVPLAALVAECQQRYHVFHVIMTNGSGYRHDGAGVRRAWQGLLGEDHVVLTDDAEHIAELVGTVIGLTEGTTTMDAAAQALEDMGVDAAAIAGIRAAVEPVARAVTLRT